jgi:hypothetical protein
MEELLRNIDIGNNFGVKFGIMSEEDKIKFCRDIKEKWDGGIKTLYDEVLRGFYEEIAIRTAPEDLQSTRKALQIFVSFEKTIRFYQRVFDELIAKYNSKEKESIINKF